MTSPDGAHVTLRTPVAPDGSLRLLFLKLSPDAIFDPVWRSIGQRVGQPGARVFYLFVAMLSAAWKAEDRGSLAGFRPEDWTDDCACEAADLLGIFEAMRGRLHDGARILKWEKWQPADPMSADRQARLRERQRIVELEARIAELQVRNAESRSVTGEREQEEETTTTGGARGFSNLRAVSQENASALLTLLARTAGDCLVTPDDHRAAQLADVSPIVALMEAGEHGAACDLAQDVLPAVSDLARNVNAGSIWAWRYFVKRILAFRDARLAGSALYTIQPELGLERPHARRRAFDAGADRSAAGSMADYLALKRSRAEG